MPQKKPKGLGLEFISDITLRKRIEGAIETTSFLYLSRNQKNTSPGLSTEYGRMEILYAASIIEAIFIFLFKVQKHSLEKIEYKDIYILPDTYQSNPLTPLVFARQIKKQRLERELMLDILLDYFNKTGVIKRKLKAKIDRARNVRNTFHLTKIRTGIRCDAVAVNSAYDAVIEVFDVVKKELS